MLLLQIYNIDFNFQNSSWRLWFLISEPSILHTLTYCMHLDQGFPTGPCKRQASAWSFICACARLGCVCKTIPSTHPPPPLPVCGARNVGDRWFRLLAIGNGTERWRFIIVWYHSLVYWLRLFSYCIIISKCPYFYFIQVILDLWIRTEPSISIINHDNLTKMS